ncbi:hypothetical protein NA57DRAFT_75713 [Rhizodiscina lignyota]|uniref:Zn(2)-C6 fungal-type domain-containing protein n=1 Tax=Rhizodiscina lignyota TaxID=1504668 RepID=A0A9P4MA66_9PEZI|nr:hypothetical protein NA57DRAFT_75713 [Rhizodiscina lignyota]
MRPKACTQCRQRKVGCDADTAPLNRCSTCRSLEMECVFDGGFRRVSNKRKMTELQKEVEELRATMHLGQAAPSRDAPPQSRAAQHPPGAKKPAESPDIGTCLIDRTIGEVCLTAAQTMELFRVYFARCHPYLPLVLHSSIELLYARSTLLFWTICFIAAPNNLRNQLEAPLKAMVTSALDPTMSTVELVQALLILSMWPLPFTSQRDDASFLYSGLATQIGLQIGLHRPSMSDDFSPSASSGSEDQEMRTVTWLACYVVGQMQASRRGVPASILVDYTLLTSCEKDAVPPVLSQLCYISRLTVQAANTIGASAHNLTGLMEPNTRIGMVKLFSSQFESLRRERFSRPTDVVEMAFLSSRLQILAFALDDDIPRSIELIDTVEQAKQDAIRFIQIACEKNLGLVPFYICRSVCYSVLVLLRILKTPFANQRELIKDSIERARTALGSSVQTEKDINHRICLMLQAVISLEEKSGPRMTTSIRSRMTASLTCNSVRTYAEMIYQPDLDLDLASFADLDAFNWDGLLPNFTSETFVG